MDSSICNFISDKIYHGNIVTIHFVYETEFNKLKQPFYHPTFRLHLVNKGKGVLKLADKEYELSKGCLFFSFPTSFYEIKADSDFSYYYISFMGEGVPSLLSAMDIDIYNPTYKNHNDLIDFWKNSIKRLNNKNDVLLTEGVLLYTLSFINNKITKDNDTISNEELIKRIIDYITNHYNEKNLSLKMIADNFSYTEKYLSTFFKSKTSMNFKSYLNELRVQYACKLLKKGDMPIYEVADKCGFYDPLYFSKVFKNQTGFTPTKYQKTFHI